MKKIQVQLGASSYTIYVQAGLRHRLPALLKAKAGRGRILVLSDANLKLRYPSLFTKLKKTPAELFFIKPGEKSKTLETVESIVGFMLRNGFDRSSLLVALGGGVVGDIGGLAASLYMRGIPYVQVPTTLLSQVDSSVGGKTGVNHALGKNMIGTFCQPAAVFIDTDFLKTLSGKEFLNGFAEVIKHGIIRNRRFFALLEKNLAGILNRKPAFIDQIVTENCRIKAAVVSRDEKEKSLRAILNFGHTFGHAVETLAGYGTYSHGEAVLLGMKAATVTSLAAGCIGSREARKILAFLGRIPAPPMPDISPGKVYAKMFMDKKARDGRLTLVLPTRIGQVRVAPDPGKTAVLAGIMSMVGRL
jgi:3-dehydroquinate synthase